MIEHAHGKHRIETAGGLRQFLQGEGQLPDRGIRQIAADGLELGQEQQVRIHTDDHARAVLPHAPHVITIAAADIQYALALKFDMRRDPIPFPVRAPFGIDLHAKQLEWPLAPGMQALQRVMQSLLLFGR